MPTASRSAVLTLLAWTLAGVGIALVAAGLLLWAGRGFGPLPVSFGRSVLGVIGLVVAPLTYLTFGALLAARVQRNTVGWLILGSGLLLATMLPVNLIVAAAHESLRRPDEAIALVAWLRASLATPGVATLLIMAVLLFPDGRPLRPGWFVSIGAAIVGGLLLALGAALDPSGLATYPTMGNPTAAPMAWAEVVTAISVTGVSVLIVTAIHAVASLAARYRVGDALQRAQLRWILFAAMLTAATAVPFLLTRYLVDVGNTLGELSALAVQLAMSSFPIAAAAAISRYRLYDVDLLIGRTLVYVPLMAILSGLYTASIALIQRLFVAVTGETSDVAVLLTLLIVASAFTPVRRALETALERRFQPGQAPAPAPSPADGAGGSAGGTEPLSGSPDGSVALARLVPIGDDDQVDCSRFGERVGLSRCLDCTRLRAITTSPVHAVVCAIERPGR